MLASVELQIISKLLVSEDEHEIDTLCSFDSSYYSVFKKQIEFIFNHRSKYGSTPDVFTFQVEFPDVNIVSVSESLDYLCDGIRKNKQHILLLETFNKLKGLGDGDVSDAWKYLQMQCDLASNLDSSAPLDLIKDAKKRSDQIIEYSKQSRIPTGFPEIDKLMYGGLSTVEELVLIVARTNSGKSWFCTKMMESAQSNGFPVLYYSPEMQASFLGTRFDTWRNHFQNSQLHQGKYSPEYIEYIDNLSKQNVSAFVLEDKDVSEGCVDVKAIENLVKKHHIKLVIVDGLSYMTDSRKSDVDHIKYKHICEDLFKLSKQQSCAVVAVVQANRETKDCKDDKGEPFPNLYTISSSDHPARIATQAFALRQVFDKHVLDVRLEKSRSANNQKPVLSYAWDVNTGNIQFLPDGEDVSSSDSVIAPVDVSTTISPSIHCDDDLLSDDDFFDDVEF